MTGPWIAAAVLFGLSALSLLLFLAAARAGRGDDE